MRYNNYYCSDGEQVTPIDIEEHDRQVIDQRELEILKRANHILYETDLKDKMNWTSQSVYVWLVELIRGAEE